VERNLNGEITSAKISEYNERELGSSGLEFNIKSGSFIQGNENEEFEFNTINFMDNGKKFASCTTSMNPLRGLVTIETDSGDYNSTLSIDLSNLTSDGKATVTGNINGNAIKGKIDPNVSDAQLELEQGSRSFFQNLFSVEAMKKIDQFKDVLDSVGTAESERSMQGTRGLDVTADKGWLGSLVKVAAPHVTSLVSDFGGTRDISYEQAKNERLIGAVVAAVAPTVIKLVGKYAVNKLGQVAGNVVSSVGGQMASSIVSATARPRIRDHGR